MKTRFQCTDLKTIKKLLLWCCTQCTKPYSLADMVIILLYSFCVLIFHCKLYLKYFKHTFEIHGLLCFCLLFFKSCK